MNEIKNLTIFVKTAKGVFEVKLNKSEKKEVLKIISKYQIILIDKDVSEIINLHP